MFSNARYLYSIQLCYNLLMDNNESGHKLNSNHGCRELSIYVYSR